MQIDDCTSSQNITFQKEISKRNFPKISFAHFALKYPSQTVFRPFHSINPPRETATASSAAARAAAGPAWAIRPVMPSITRVNTTVQQSINKTCEAHVSTFTKFIQYI